MAKKKKPAAKKKEKPAEEVTNSKWFQFNRKSLLLIVVIAILPLAWYGYERFSYRHHWGEALPVIAQLQERGALLIYGNESDVRSEKPAWVRRMVRDIYPERISGIGFQGDCRADTLALLPQLNSLSIQNVIFEECQLETSGLKYLRECQHLKRVKMVGGILSGKGFGQVFLVPTLESLRLEKVPLSDSDLTSLDKATQLQVLQLSKTALDAEDVKRIGRLPNLRDLWLNGDQLSSLAGLNDAKSLESLDLSGSTVSDSMLTELERLPNLRQLTLSETKVTVASIPSLTRFSKLEYLVVDDLTLGPAEMKPLKTMSTLRTVVDSSGTITVNSPAKK